MLDYVALNDLAGNVYGGDYALTKGISASIRSELQVPQYSILVIFISSN